MNSFKYFALGAGLCLAGFFGLSYLNRAADAQKVARNQWEYAAIRSAYSITPYADRMNRIYGMAQICYLEAQGCKNSELKFELDYGTYLQDRAIRDSYDARKGASIKAGEVAFQRALAQLGNDGWELVTDAPNLEFEMISLDDFNRFDDRSTFFDRKDTNAVYFKRLKQQ